MTYRDLYKRAFGLTDNHYTDSEWRSIESEMAQVIAADTDAKAAKVIEWWYEYLPYGKGRALRDVKKLRKIWNR